jgi:hypothetical protein
MQGALQVAVTVGLRLHPSTGVILMRPNDHALWYDATQPREVQRTAIVLTALSYHHRTSITPRLTDLALERRLVTLSGVTSWSEVCGAGVVVACVYGGALQPLQVPPGARRLRAVRKR